MRVRDVPRRGDYAWWQRLTTRWVDNDVYGHVNNAVYYAYFDSVINAYLIQSGGLDFRAGAAVAFIVSSRCDYFRPLSYPDAVEVGLSADRIGRSSVSYRLGIFGEGDEQARAAGSMTHVFVDRATTQATPIPATLRAALEAIARPRAGGGASG